MTNKLFTSLIWPFRVLAFICLLVLLFLGASEVGGRIKVNQNFTPTAGGIEIFVISNGIHTDIAVPYKNEQRDWSKLFPTGHFNPAVANASPASYLSFGWGDRGLYENVPTWDDLTLAITIESMLWPTQSAMHVTYLSGPPTVGEWVRSVHLSPDQYDVLINEIEHSFSLDDAGRPVSLNCCWYGHINDNFYESPPRYHLLRTCNNWTNRVLKKTGVPTALWTPNHDHILRHLPPAPP